MSKEVKNPPFISVITVVFNRKDDLELTLKNILSQNFHSFELIVIDGGSTDGTLDVLNKYSEHISFWVSEPDKGIYNAMNKGIKASKGEWINFMNAGDEYASDHIFNNILTSSQDCEILVGDTCIDYGNFTRILHSGDLNNLWQGAQFIHQSVFIKKTFQVKNLYNTTNQISADFEFFYRSFKSNARFVFIPSIVSIFRAHGISDQKRVSAVFANMRVVFNVDGFSVKVFLFYILHLIKQSSTLLVKALLPQFMITKIQLRIHDNS